MSNLRKFSDINEVEALSSAIKFAADLKHFDILYVPNIFFFALSLSRYSGSAFQIMQSHVFR